MSVHICTYIHLYIFCVVKVWEYRKTNNKNKKTKKKITCKTIRFLVEVSSV